MKIMLTGDMADGITWLDVSMFDIQMMLLYIETSCMNVLRPILTLNSIAFQELLGCVIHEAGARRHIVETGEVVPYVASC